MKDIFADTLLPPYYIVAFSSRRIEGNDGYAEIALSMEMLAAQQPGYLGAESTRDAGGFGITNSFWKDEKSIKAWKANVEHQIAQKLGREKFYERYIIRIAKVERDYGFEK